MNLSTMSPEEVKRLAAARTEARRNGKPLPDAVPPVATAEKKRRGMNKWEARFSEQLEAKRVAGLIHAWSFETMRFRLADGAWYKPDMAVVLSTGELVLYEVKGFWREAARVRIKVAAELHPHRFIAVTLKNGAWQEEVFNTKAIERRAIMTTEAAGSYLNSH